jgi:large subunit ribosomal protein L18
MIKNAREIRRKKKVRSKIFGTGARPRLSVFRSNKFTYAQLIDDEQGVTLVSASDKELAHSNLLSLKKTKQTSSPEAKAKNKQSAVKEKLSKIERARAVGDLVAKKAVKKKIVEALFDRGGYKYHGRIRAVAEGARNGGLKF